MAPNRRGISKKAHFKVGGGRLQQDYQQRSFSLGHEGRKRAREQISMLHQAERTGLSDANQRALDSLDGKEEAMDGGDDVGMFEMRETDAATEGDVSAGGESFIHEIREMMSKSSFKASSRRYVDHRTRSQRLERLEASWTSQMDALAEALLQYRLDSTKGTRTCSEEGMDFPVIDIYTKKAYDKVDFGAYPLPGVAMVNAGYMPTSPVNPQLGISINTLALYHVIRLRQPSFSVQAFTKVICDVYRFPYRRNYRNQLSQTFEIYVRLCDKIDAKVQKACGRDAKNWRVKNACPPCTYELQDEPPLRYKRIVAMDGNNSAKRVDGASADTRTLEDNDYYIPAGEVDRFANEVKSRDPPESEDLPWMMEGDPTDGDLTSSGCASRWKAASADTVKKMWGMFDESGIFASACRHGLILWVEDMIKSGELAKYPLAATNRMLEELGNDVLIGFDIGCSFGATVASSSLAERFKAQGFRVCTNAFHGYAHNYECQTKHHPNGIIGAGLEDMETMERVFSASNSLARIIRYSTKYTRRLWILTHFKQWDADKYLNLGQMLVSNYRQALKIIEEETLPLNHALKERQLTPDDLDRFRQEEIDYLKELKEGKNRIDQQAVAYVRLLERLKNAQNFYDGSRQDHVSSVRTFSFVDESQPQEYAKATSRTLREETKRQKAKEALEKVEAEVIEMEMALEILPQRRWKPSEAQYKKALEQISLREYHDAIDKLELLVCQRLFELQRLNISQTGYNMRMSIIHALKRRSQAIQTAVKAYNSAAQKLEHPRPPIDWQRVSHYEWLQDFVLLRETDPDILNRRWADPVIRFTMKQHLRILRAHEEITRCNVEIRRLQTHIHDENLHLDSILSKLREDGPPAFVFEFEDFAVWRKRVNDKIMYDLQRIFNDSRYSGNRTLGSRIGVAVAARPGGVVMRGVAGEHGVEEDRLDDTDDSEEDEENDQSDALIQYMSDLTV